MVSAENGRVFFEGDENILARANINSRYAERILIVLDRFKAVTFEELFQGVKRCLGRNLSAHRIPFLLKATV